MTDRPIIFSAPMVRAILDGRKTMTRRLAWGKPIPGLYESDGGPLTPVLRPSPWTRVKPGDRLWVRETFTIGFDYDEHDKPIGDEPKPFYAATFGGRWYETDTDSWRDSPLWRPSIRMPRWASRLTLIVTATKIERLQEISEVDAKAEGVDPQIMHANFGYGSPNSGGEHDYARGFADLWDRLHGPESWSANPEVVALTFRVVRANIDSKETQS